METTQSFIANVEILNEKLRRETWYQTFWAKFAGNVDISSDENGNPRYKPSGKPIEILNQFIQEGRDNMLIPFLKRLTGSPVFGDTVLKGTGEDQSLNWLRSFVNQTRKAVMKKSGSMSEQRQKVYKLYSEAQPQLRDWFAQWENQSVFQAFYEGVSPNLSYGTNSDGLGLAKRYHPNWYANISATLTKVGTEKAFTLNSELDTVIKTGGTCDTEMTSLLLRNLRTKCMELKIPQIVTKSGYKFWALLCHPQTVGVLWGDTDFKNAQRESWSTRMLDSPELNGASGAYAGFCIYEDIIGIRQWEDVAGTDGSTGTFFGTTMADRFTATDSAVTVPYNSIVFGGSAMGKGIAKDMHFTNEIDDHANTIEVGGAQISGYNRADFVAEDKAGKSSGAAAANVFSTGNATTSEYATATPAFNQSSLIISTKDDAPA